MDDGGGNGGGSFRVKHGSDAAEVTDVHEAGAGEVGDVVGEREMRIKSLLSTLLDASLHETSWKCLLLRSKVTNDKNSNSKPKEKLIGACNEGDSLQRAIIEGRMERKGQEEGR